MNKKTRTNKPYETIKTLSERARAKDREVAAGRVDDKQKRETKAAKARKVAAAIMKKTLITYPKNAPIGEQETNRAEAIRKERNLNAKGRAMQKKTAGKTKSAARQLRMAEKKAAREQRVALRKTAQAEKKAARDARKVERQEAMKMKKLQRIEPSKEMLDSAMKVVREQFKMSDKKAMRVRENIMGRFAEKALRQQKNYLQNFRLRLALLEAYNTEVVAVLAKTADAPKATPVVEERVKATKQSVKSVKKAVRAAQVGVIDDEAVRKQTRKENKEEAAAFSASLAMANRVRISDAPRPAPKATAGKPLTKKIKK